MVIYGTAKRNDLARQLVEALTLNAVIENRFLFFYLFPAQEF